MYKIISEYYLGDMFLQYVTQDSNNVGIIFVPASKANDIQVDLTSCAVEPLVQFKLHGDHYADAKGCGITCRDSGTIKRLKYVSQTSISNDDNTRITTILSCGDLEVLHEFLWYKDYDILESKVKIVNNGIIAISLEMMASFSVGMISPFMSGLNKLNLKIYRMRSRWANEACLQSQLAEDLMLVPSSKMKETYTERYGQIGSKPTNCFIPFVGVEDIKNGIMWGVQLAIASSWQIELSRRDNGLSISGGLADYDFGAWMKNLAPSESFISPSAYISTCCGNIDDLCYRLVNFQKRSLVGSPQSDDQLPVVCNEWCTTWGVPSEYNMIKLVNAIQNWPIKYLVMDAGWYKNDAYHWSEVTGDWNPSTEKYPNGLKNTCDIIRSAGFIPGIWFEIETCGIYSNIFQQDEHLLQKLGKPLICGNRKFLDFRQEWVWDYLRLKVIDLIKECGIGYLKIDSNETIGLGCDGNESLGEGLRQLLIRVEDFIKEIRVQIPELIIENCSSGGQRLVSNFMAITNLASFSDAFETDDIPIIAANLHRVILPVQSGVWCILRHTDDEKRLYYSLSATFLGRIYLSGDLFDLTDNQISLVMSAFDDYCLAVPVIKDGFSRRYGPKVLNYRDPDGWQAVVRESLDLKNVMVIVHAFNIDEPLQLKIPLPEGQQYMISWSFKRHIVQTEICNHSLCINLDESKEGLVIMLESKK